MPRKTQCLASRRTDHQGIPQIPSPLSASPREPSARTRVLSPACDDPRRRRGCAGGCSHAVPGPGRSQGGGRSHLSARGGRSDYRRSAAADIRRPADALSLGPTPIVDRIASRVMSVSIHPQAPRRAALVKPSRSSTFTEACSRERANGVRCADGPSNLHWPFVRSLGTHGPRHGWKPRAREGNGPRSRGGGRRHPDREPARG